MKNIIGDYPIFHWDNECNLHRLDGPAIMFKDGEKLWYYHGQHIKCESQEEFEKIVKMKAFI